MNNILNIFCFNTKRKGTEGGGMRCIFITHKQTRNERFRRMLQNVRLKGREERKKKWERLGKVIINKLSKCTKMF